MAKQSTSNAAQAHSRTEPSAAPRAGQTRKKAVSKVAAATTPAPRAPERTGAPLHQDIAEHAYGLYLARGASEGGAVSDWLRAEHELCARPELQI